MSSEVLVTGNFQNEENTPTEYKIDNSNLITTPKKKISKHSPRKKFTAAERLARCAITENKEILNSVGILGIGNAQNEENAPTEYKIDNSNLIITTPKKKISKHSPRKKLTAAERLARCAITEIKIILDVPPDEKHSKIGKQSRRTRTYETYEKYYANKLGIKLQNLDSQNSDESEFYMPDHNNGRF